MRIGLAFGLCRSLPEPIRTQPNPIEPIRTETFFCPRPSAQFAQIKPSRNWPPHWSRAEVGTKRITPEQREGGSQADQLPHHHPSSIIHHPSSNPVQAQSSQTRK